MKIGGLIPYVNNSRTHSELQVAQIAASIREFGFTNPVLIDEKKNVIAGHGRIAAAKLLEMAEVPCIVLEGLSDTKRKALIIADNQLAMNAGWDLDALKLELNALTEDNFDLNILGFDEDFLLGLTGQEPVEGLTDDDDVPEIPQNVHGVVLGDIWQLGNHRLVCGDATEISSIEKAVDNTQVDLVWTDPPYNVAYEGKTKEKLTIKNDKMDDEKFMQFLIDAFVNMQTVMKHGASFYVAHADSFGFQFRYALSHANLTTKQCLIWVKNTLVMGRSDYHWKHEPILYGWLEGAAHSWYNDRKQTTVLEFDKPQRNGEHPTMKPVELVEYCIKNSSKAGQIVLDPFLGSGSTLIACEKTNRRCVGTELDPHYCSVIIERWQKFTGKKAERVNAEAS